MRLLGIGALLWTFGCNGESEDSEKPVTDQDRDGYAAAEDCDDTDRKIYPGAEELCNEVDDDCDGTVDNDPVDEQIFYADTDADGYGNPSATGLGCTAPTGFVEDRTDCDDARADIHPGATETDCEDPIDYNCDGSTQYADLDGDGYPACGECNDLIFEVNPAADERCNNRDDNCDGTADENAVDQRTWYADADRDGYGDLATAVTSCDSPSGYTTDSRDCDDANYDRNPGQREVCDDAGLDEDCDNLVDDDDPNISAASQFSWYTDTDGDGYGDEATVVVACVGPSGWNNTGGDCDDGDVAIHPGAQEICDAGSVDEDCDSFADDADVSVSRSSYNLWYRDSDSDGYGATSVTISRCDAPAGYLSIGGDCNDAVATISPAGTEICDSANQDEDCDSLTDDSDPDIAESDKSTWYLDNDSDGYGETSSTTIACDAPTGYSSVGADCDDSARGVNPGAQESCDSADTDEDCDGLTDDSDPSVNDQGSWYIDLDADGYGTGSATRACDIPAQSAGQSGDCNDSNRSISPGVTEICDSANTDEDCDGLSDDADPSATGKSTVYADNDGDGYGTASQSASQCDISAGQSANNSDCNDSLTAVHPGASEICDSQDNDCDGYADDADLDGDGIPAWYVDVDGDGYGNDASVLHRCTQPGGAVSTGGDCNDSSTTFSPAAPEVCGDGLDQDCSNEADDCSVAGTRLLSTANARYFGSGSQSTVGKNVDINDGLLYISSYEGGITSTHELDVAVGDTTVAAPVFGAMGSSAVMQKGAGTYFIGTSDTYGAGTDGVYPALQLSLSSPITALSAQNGATLLGFSGSGSSGEARYYAESVTGYDPAATATFPGGTSGDSAGAAVLLQDINGDGLDDALIGMPNAIFTLGLVSIQNGPNSGTLAASNNDSSLTGAGFGDRTGGSLASAGDVNNDGYEDWLAGAITGGKVYLVTGRAGSGSLNTAQAAASFTDSNGFGASIAGNADFDGDGSLDIVVSTTTSSGAAYAFYGPFSGAYTTTSAVGAMVGTGTSAPSMAAGDVDNDGFDDLLIGVPSYGSYGAAFLFLGAE